MKYLDINKIKIETSLVAQTVKRPLAMQETQVQYLGWEDPLEKGMATHSSTLAWKIPWTKKLGRLQSRGLQRNYSNKRRVNNTLEYLFIKKNGLKILRKQGLMGEFHPLIGWLKKKSKCMSSQF